MEQTELEILIGDVEVAIDRLRSLYDQYFMGIEKIEPAVARKDVDRRIYGLRKEPIRNTALRFRFQMILQRYNTFQTHWQRICRGIENGTYKRHVLRAEQRFGPGAAKGRRSSAPPPAQSVAPTPPPLPPQPAPAPPPLRRPKPEPGAPLPAELAAELAELDEAFAPAPPQDDVLLAAARRNAAARPQVAPAKPVGPPPPARAQANAIVPPARAEGAPPQVPLSGARAPPTPIAQRPAVVSTSASPLRPPAPRTAAPPTAPPIAPRVPPTAPSTPAAARPPPPVPARALSLAPPAPPNPPAPVAPKARTPAPAAPAPRAAATVREEGLSDNRVRQLYVEYVEAKRRQNESTAAITYDVVAQSLRDSSARLRQRHGKPVDFEIAIRDGKAFLKPVLK